MWLAWAAAALVPWGVAKMGWEGLEVSCRQWLKSEGTALLLLCLNEVLDPGTDACHGSWQE